MSKTNFLFLAFALTATGVAHAMPLETMIEEQRGAMADEIAKKRAELRAPSNAPGATVATIPGLPTIAMAPGNAPSSEEAKSAGPDINDVSVVAVYGEEGKLRADISVRAGVAAARREGGEVLPGWFIESINSQYVSFVKGRKKGKSAQRHVVYITEPANNVTSQARGIAQGSGVASPLPPMPAMSPAMGANAFRR